jgi:hypothetical protein
MSTEKQQMVQPLPPREGKRLQILAEPAFLKLRRHFSNESREPSSNFWGMYKLGKRFASYHHANRVSLKGKGRELLSVSALADGSSPYTPSYQLRGASRGISVSYHC